MPQLGGKTLHFPDQPKLETVSDLATMTRYMMDILEELARRIYTREDPSSCPCFYATVVTRVTGPQYKCLIDQFSGSAELNRLDGFGIVRNMSGESAGSGDYLLESAPGKHMLCCRCTADGEATNYYAGWEILSRDHWGSCE